MQKERRGIVLQKKMICLIGAVVLLAVCMFAASKNNRNAGENTLLFGTEHTQEPYASAPLSEEQVPDVQALAKENPDCIGWLRIPDTKIDDPVLQHLADENYYLDKDFYQNEDKNGSLILDNDSDLKQVGTNLIIHGHNMKSGEMFGLLPEYEKESYGKEHSLIYLYTEEELRTYQLIAVFYSKVYYENEDVFKYYKYFGQGKTEFEEFYENIKALSMYDTGVEAVYGDEFLTLSTCTYHTENGRFVVVGKRIY